MQVHRVSVGPEPGTDYTSTFALTPGAGMDTRVVAAAVFGRAPAPFRTALQLGWRRVLRLRLDGPADTLGWAVVDGPGSTSLLAAGPLLQATNRVQVTGTSLTWTTTVTYRSRLGRVLWSAAAPMHHLTLPWLLRRAAGDAAGDAAIDAAGS